MPKLELKLWHGRAGVDQSLDTWGEQGPTVHGITQVQVTYGHLIRVTLESPEAYANAQRQTGWTTWDEGARTLAGEMKGDCLYSPATRLYYGDWSVTSGASAA